MIDKNEGIYSFYDTQDNLLGNNDVDSDGFEFIEPTFSRKTSLDEFDIINVPALPQTEQLQKKSTSQDNKQKEQANSQNIPEQRTLKFYQNSKVIYSKKIKSNETLNINLNGSAIDFQIQSNQENTLFIKKNSKIQIKQYLETYKTTIIEGPIQIGQNWISCSKQDQSTSTFVDEAMQKQISHLQYSTNQFRDIYQDNAKTKIGKIVWDGQNFTYQHYLSYVKARMDLQNNSRFISDSWYLINNQMYYFEY